VTRPFRVLWCSTLLFYLGFQLLLPVVPLYAAALGAREAHVGFIMGSFALAAMVPRPIAGDLADRIGRRPLVLLGTAIFMLAPVGYALVGAIPGLLVVRLFHGAGMGFGPTAATVIATDLTPLAQRGAAMGLYGLAPAVALAVGPYAGGEFVRRLGFGSTFLVATAIEAVALALAWTLPETRPAAGLARASLAPPAGAPGGALARFWRRWFSTAAVYPSALVLSLYVSYGGLAALLPLFAERASSGTWAVLHGLRAGGPGGEIARGLAIGPARSASGGCPCARDLGRGPGGARPCRVAAHLPRRGSALRRGLRRGAARASRDDGRSCGARGARPRDGHALHRVGAGDLRWLDAARSVRHHTGLRGHVGDGRGDRGAGRARRALADRETARLTVVGPSPGGPGRPRQRGVPRSPPAVRRTRGAGGLWTALVDTS
jgi:MFS family permease